RADVGARRPCSCADSLRLLPRLACIGRAAEQHDRLFELPLDPGDVKVAAMWTLRMRVRPDSWHVFELHVWLVALPHHHADWILVPRPAAVGRSPHPNTVGARAVAPIRRQAGFFDR